MIPIMKFKIKPESKYLTYIASSLVGASTIAYILPYPSNLYFLKYSTTGRPNAKVFPDPVKSLAITSSLL